MNGPGPTSLCAAFCTVLRYRVSTRRVHVGRACTSLLAIRQRHAKRQPRENAIWLIGHCSDHRYTTCNNHGCWPWCCCCCCKATLRGPSCTDRSWVRSRKPSSQTHRARHNKADAAVVYHASPSESQAGSPLPYPQVERPIFACMFADSASSEAPASMSRCRQVSYTEAAAKTLR
jgi:hypothetical protein